MKLIFSLKHTIKKYPLLYKILSNIYKYCNPINIKEKCSASIQLVYFSKKIHKHNERKKVAFLCQYIPAWNKFEAIYKRLIDDTRFETFLICVPYDISKIDITKSISVENDTFEYFISNGYDAINACTKQGWLDLKSMHLDYVFYTRPYNIYLPKEYNSHEVAKYTKVANLLYAMELTKDTYDTVLNTDFFKDVSLFFAETEYSRKRFLYKFPITTYLGIRKAFFNGMPALEQVLLDKNKTTDVWNFYDSNFKILWTPRWTTNQKLGGSNFFLYKDKIIDYAVNHSDIAILCRPHPLMFDNFIKTGEMTKEDVDRYKKLIQDTTNVGLDESKEYDAILWASDVMVSDISGIMPEYFITGKPLIYCSSNMILTLAEHTKEMLKGCYIAESEKQLFYYLEQLRQGIDPLADTRKRIIYNVFGKNLKQASSAIIDILADIKD